MMLFGMVIAAGLRNGALDSTLLFTFVFMNIVGYDSTVVEYKWFHPKDDAVQFDPGGKELPVMVIHDFILEDCSYNDTFSKSPVVF